MRSQTSSDESNTAKRLGAIKKTNVKQLNKQYHTKHEDGIELRFYFNQQQVRSRIPNGQKLIIDCNSDQWRKLQWSFDDHWNYYKRVNPNMRQTVKAHAILEAISGQCQTRQELGIVTTANQRDKQKAADLLHFFTAEEDKSIRTISKPLFFNNLHVENSIDNVNRENRKAVKTSRDFKTRESRTKEPETKRKSSSRQKSRANSIETNRNVMFTARRARRYHDNEGNSSSSSISSRNEDRRGESKYHNKNKIDHDYNSMKVVTKQLRKTNLNDDNKKKERESKNRRKINPDDRRHAREAVQYSNRERKDDMANP